MDITRKDQNESLWLVNDKCVIPIDIESMLLELLVCEFPDFSTTEINAFTALSIKFKPMVH